MDFSNIFGPLLQVVDSIFLYINSFVYDFINFLYQIFMAIADARLFSNDIYMDIANKIYAVIGVVSLFIISYALLRAIIDPDSAGKGELSASKIIPNVIKVIVLIAFVPTIFNFAFKMQEVIFRTNIIGNLVMGEDSSKKIAEEETGDNYSYQLMGLEIANDAFTSFLYPAIDSNGDQIKGEDIEILECYFPPCDGIVTPATKALSFGRFAGMFLKLGKYINPAIYLESRIGEEVLDYISGKYDKAYNFEIAKAEVYMGTKSFQVYANFASKIHGSEKKLEFNGLMQLVAGGIIAYVLINFCIDLGVRAVKLAYYQIIAPLPILTIILPGQKKAFDNWLKSVTSTFLDVFIRVFVLYLGLFLIHNLPSMETLWEDSSIKGTEPVLFFARAFIIVGILLFIKQAPKLITDLFNIGSGGFKFGVKDKLSEAFDFSKVPGLGRAEGALTGAAGGAWSSLMNKGDAREGAKAGFLNGLYNGGLQFDKQRRTIYKGMGKKGNPGWFGGQQLTEKWAQQAEDHFKDDYQKRVLSTRIEQQERFADPKNRIHQIFEDAKTRLEAEQKANITRSNDNVQDAQIIVDNAETAFNSSKSTKLADLQAQISDADVKGNVKIEEAKANFEAQKTAKIDNIEAQLKQGDSRIVNETLDTRKVWDENRNKKLASLKTELDAQKGVFEANKSKELGRLNAELDSYKTAGDTANYEKTKARIDELNASQFDSSPIQSQIEELQNAKFEDSDVYKQLERKFNTNEKIMMEHLNAELNKKVEDDQAYKDAVAERNANHERLTQEYRSVYNSKVEDDATYKEAEAKLKEAQVKHKKEVDRLKELNDANGKPIYIYRHVYDEKTKELKKMVYNPNHTKPGGGPIYLDENDTSAANEELLKKARVTAIDVEADKEAIKTLRDRDETFKEEEGKLRARIKEKENDEWMRSDDGLHLSAALDKALNNNKSSKDDKK